MSFSKKMLKAAAVFLLFSLCFLGGRTVSWLLSTQEEAAASSSLLFSSENWGLSYPEEGKLPTGNASIMPTMPKTQKRRFCILPLTADMRMVLQLRSLTL